MNNNDSHLTNNIIAVASGKGGVGKTWLSITLSHLVARSGRRVLLFDGDIGLANIDVQLGLRPEKDLCTVFSGKAKLQDIIFHYAGGFDILAGRSGSTRLASASVSNLETIKEDLLEMARNYDCVFMDLGAGIEQHVQYMAGIASRCVVVITSDPTSLTDAYAFIKLCLTKLNTTSIQIVINQAASQKEGEKTFSAIEKACQNFLHFTPSLLGVVRKDNKVRDAIRSQSSILDNFSGTLAASDAAAIAVKLMQKS